MERVVINSDGLQDQVILPFTRVNTENGWNYIDDLLVYEDEKPMPFAIHDGNLVINVEKGKEIYNILVLKRFNSNILNFDDSNDMVLVNIFDIKAWRGYKFKQDIKFVYNDTISPSLWQTTVSPTVKKPFILRMKYPKDNFQIEDFTKWKLKYIDPAKMKTILLSGVVTLFMFVFFMVVIHRSKTRRGK